ncbi:MAG: HAMP domain-containing protein [SAR324 cluster bacterium]|uniref:histidine kinase n=1 Tax=SAR324 cluster bacterium TaxID=2024889 RepID=A0A7X9FQN8_9DELT|nr:HAMP domain-containing protein [SAR324 cluster bacterium]
MKSHLRISLRTKLLLLISLAILPAVSVTVFVGLEWRDKAVSDARRSAERILSTIVTRQEVLVENARQLLITLSQIPNIQKANAEEAKSLFRELLKEHPAFSNILLDDEKGNVIASAVEISGPLNNSDRKYFKEVIATSDFAVGEYAISRSVGLPSLHFAYPVLDSNKRIIGVLILVLNLSSYSNIFDTALLPEGSTMSFADWKRKILFHYPTNNEFRGKNDKVWNQKDLATNLEGTPIIEEGLDGIKRIYALRALKIRENAEPYLHVRIGIPEAIALADVHSMEQRSLAFISLVFAIALACAWLWGKISITDRILNVVAAAEEIAAGHLESRVQVSAVGDEISGLGIAINTMAAALESRQRERESAEAELRKSLGEKEVLLRELQHRVKNNLQAIIALISMQGGRASTISKEEMLLNLEGRVRAMALVHESLIEIGTFENIKMQNYFENLLNRIIEAYSPTSHVKRLIDAQNVSLKIDTVIACGLIVNELATNSMKYAFSGLEDKIMNSNSKFPSIELRMTRNDKLCSLSFKDNGVGFPKEFDLEKSQSLGLQLVNLLVKNQLGGEININSQNGVEFDINFNTEET